MSLLLLPSCGQDNPPSTDYVARLSNVLKIENLDPTLAVNVTVTNLTTLPSPAKFNRKLSKELNTPFSGEFNSTLSIREFLGLRQCKLHLVIAERNSQMGKVASASQRLKNDLAVLATGPDCLIKLENGTLKTKLSDYLDKKRQRIPGILWHALFAQREYQTFWRPQAHRPNYPAKLRSASVIDDLKQLDQAVGNILSGHYAITETEFGQLEGALGRLRYGDGGQLLSELYALNNNLSVANQMINARLTQKLCVTPKPTTQARYVQNVVNGFFILNVQAHAVTLKQRHEQLMPIVKQLEQRLAQHAPVSFTQWLSDRERVMNQALASPREHALLLQKLYAQCGLKAGNK